MDKSAPKVSSASLRNKKAAPTIYVVDDLPALTELYVAILELAGYFVRAFNDRELALTALKSDAFKPELLVVDYLSPSIPIGTFLEQCLLVHPDLKIMMASGCSPTEVRLSKVRPDRYVQKPFTPEEFLRQVEAALGA